MWESWTIRKAECQRIAAFELWPWWRLLRVLWTARSNQSILKEINPEYSLEGLMLKFLYFGHLMQRADSLEKTDAGESWRQKEKQVAEDEMVGWHHRFNGHEFEQTLGAGEGQGKPDLLPSMASHRVGHDLVTEQQLWNHRHHECHKHNHHLQKCPLGFWSFVYLLTCAMNTYIRFTLLAHF